MKRRDFIKHSLQSFALLSGTQAFAAITPQRHHFLTRDKIKLRFAIASDGHYGQPETEYERFHDEIIWWINNEHKKIKLNFTVFNGDLIHDDRSFLGHVKKKYDLLQMPYYVSRGNHDRCDRDHWQEQWGTPTNHSFLMGDNAFLILDTSNENGDYLCPDMDWVKEAFARYQSTPNLFVFMHITPKKWTGAGIDCGEVTDLFAKQENLRAVFHGHDHNEDNVKESGGKPYFFDSHIGGNWGTEYRGYRIVEITNKNDIITYQMNPQSNKPVNTNRLDSKSRSSR
jgi:3',5'-cyclic-AMP phosphodiesterase